MFDSELIFSRVIDLRAYVCCVEVHGTRCASIHDDGEDTRQNCNYEHAHKNHGIKISLILKRSRRKKKSILQSSRTVFYDRNF